MEYKFDGKTLTEQRYTHFNDHCLQNNDIHKPFIYEEEDYFITYGSNEKYGLMDSNGYSLNTIDYGHIVRYGKIQLKKGGFFIGKNIGAVFRDEIDDKPWAIEFREKILMQLLEPKKINDNVECKNLKEQRYTHFDDQILQNNAIHKPFVYEEKNYFITYDSDEIYGLMDNNGYSLDTKDYGHILCHGKTQLKKGGFFIGKNIGSVFKDENNDKPWATDLRENILNTVINL